jgi:hypothetical protein
MLERLGDVPTTGLHRYEYRFREKSTSFLVMSLSKSTMPMSWVFVKTPTLLQAKFSCLAMAFYVEYLACEIPNGYMIQKFPVAKYLGLWSKLFEYPRFFNDNHKTPINSDARSRSPGSVRDSQLRQYQIRLSASTKSSSRMF